MKINFILLAIFTSFFATAQSVGINTDGSSANSSAMLEVKSTTKGFLPPRMTFVEKTAISTPAAGLILWCTDCGTAGELQVYNGSSWTNMIGAAAALPPSVIPTVTNGSQYWQTINLDVSSYRDGTPIPEVTDPTAWAALTTGAWCYHSNTTSNGTVYGKLYNWYAVAGIHDTDPNTPNKTLAPSGWHIPTDTEWTTLTTYLGGQSVAGGTMKSTGTTLWTSPNTNATNSSEFSGLPGGYRNFNGAFNPIGDMGAWWGSTEDSTAAAWCRNLNYYNESIDRGNPSKKLGFSVRCLRD